MVWKCLEHDFLIFPYIGNNNPIWRTHIFQRARSTTNQMILYTYIYYMHIWYSILTPTRWYTYIYTMNLYYNNIYIYTYTQRHVNTHSCQCCIHWNDWSHLLGSPFLDHGFHSFYPWRAGMIGCWSMAILVVQPAPVMLNWMLKNRYHHHKRGH